MRLNAINEIMTMESNARSAPMSDALYQLGKDVADINERMRHLESRDWDKLIDAEFLNNRITEIMNNHVDNMHAEAPANEPEPPEESDDAPPDEEDVPPVDEPVSGETTLVEDEAGSGTGDDQTPALPSERLAGPFF